MGEEKKMSISLHNGNRNGGKKEPRAAEASEKQRTLFSKLPPPKENGILKLKQATEDFALQSGQLIQNYESVASAYDHKVRMMLLFKMWAPLYDAYWILTRHEEAARQVIRQLDAVGEDATERVFLGRGLEIGSGTGLVAHEIGRLKEKVALKRLAYFRNSPASKLAQDCVRQQEHFEYLMTDPKAYEKEFHYHAKMLLPKIRRLLELDCARMSSGLMKVLYQEGNTLETDPRPIFKQYELLKRMLEDRRTTPSVLLEEESVMYLARSYIRTLGVARHILDDMEGVRSADKTELLFELRNELSSIINLTAVDISADMIEIARDKVRDVYGGAAEAMFKEEDGTMITERAAVEGWAGTFDFVVISQLLHILPDEDKKKILQGAATALGPEGKLVLIDEWSPLFSGESLESADREVKFLISQLELLFRFTFHPITEKGAMRKLIEDAGFEYSKERASKMIDGKHSMYGHIYIKE